MTCVYYKNGSALKQMSWYESTDHLQGFLSATCGKFCAASGRLVQYLKVELLVERAHWECCD